MYKSIRVTLAVCTLLSGCADLVLPPTSPTALTALEPDAQAADPDAQTATNLSLGEPTSTRSARKVAHRSQPAPQETTATSSTLDGVATAAKRAEDEWLAQRERAAKRTVSGICTGC